MWLSALDRWATETGYDVLVLLAYLTIIYELEARNKQEVPLCVFSTGCRIDGDIKGVCTFATSDTMVAVDDIPSWPALPLLVRAKCSIEDPAIKRWVSSFSDLAAVMLLAGDSDFDLCDDVSVERSMGAEPNICFQSSFCDSTHNKRINPFPQSVRRRSWCQEMNEPNKLPWQRRSLLYLVN